jgi:hypothetical protein
MPKLISVTLENGSKIMLESTEDVTVSELQKESRLISKGAVDTAITEFKSIQKTISDYTTSTLQAFEQVAAANVDKVSLEFGIEIGGEAGIPYITKGTAKSNLKITVECSFPEKKKL